MSLDADEVWKSLVAAALVGTARQAGALEAGGDEPLGVVLAGLAAGPPEQRVLDAAAALWLYRQAGQLPATDPAPLPDPCPPETRPLCGEAAARRLGRLLGGEHQPVLPEWLAALAAAGQGVPPERLPALLTWGSNQPEQQAVITAVVGERGRWLAAQNPVWDYVLGGSDAAVWETGSRAMRLAFLRRLRAADPDAARGLLNQTWPDETADDRAAFLALFAVGLSLADEPFLEAALDDRRKEVRQQATAHLVCLPQSRLVQRMIARVQPLLAYKGLLRPRIEVTLPEACDKAMIRDGIDPKPSAAIGEKAWWLCQMLGAIPPSHWSTLWHNDPATLLAAADRNKEWKGVLLDGWRQATARCRDGIWAAALLGVWPAVAHVLPPARREAGTLQLLRADRDPFHKERALVTILWQCTHPWSRELSEAVLVTLRRHVAGSAEAHWELREALKHFGRMMDPAVAPAASTGWPVDAPKWSTWSGWVDEMIAILQFRYEMLKEIAP